MKRLNLKQGTPEWHEHRAKHYNASDAPVVFGVSPYMTRAEFIRMQATGDEREIGSYLQKLFDDGHAIEDSTRVMIEATIGKMLYPVTVTSGQYSASMDGLSADATVGWECKTMNATKRKFVEQEHVPDCDAPQLAQQFRVVESLQVIYYTLSDGADYIAIPVNREQLQHLIDKLEPVWQQYQDDLDAYEHAPNEPAAVGKAMSELPYLTVQVEGKVLASNIDEYRDHAIAVFDGINTDLQTDQDYADAAEAVKFCKSVEDRLQAAKKDVLAQTADIDSLFRAVDEITETARRKRLELDRIVKARKEAQRAEIIEKRVQRLRDHIKSLAPIDRVKASAYVPENYRPQTDIADAMKGKKLISALEAAADQVVANHMIDINTAYQKVSESHKAIADLVADHYFLFPDLTQYAKQSPEAAVAMVKQRISEYEATVAQKKEAAKAVDDREKAESNDTLRAKAEDMTAKTTTAESTAEPKNLPDDYPWPKPTVHAAFEKWQKSFGKGKLEPSIREAFFAGYHAGASEHQEDDHESA